MRRILLFGAAVAVGVLLLATLASGVPGTDQRAAETVAEVAPDYDRWASSLCSFSGGRSLSPKSGTAPCSVIDTPRAVWCRGWWVCGSFRGGPVRDPSWILRWLSGVLGAIRFDGEYW